MRTGYFQPQLVLCRQGLCLLQHAIAKDALLHLYVPWPGNTNAI